MKIPEGVKGWEKAFIGTSLYCTEDQIPGLLTWLIKNVPDGNPPMTVSYSQYVSRLSREEQEALWVRFLIEREET